MGTFALVDCNNFYVSCERLFNPKLDGKPVIILSNNDGCVVARSQEAKRLGIGMGEAFFKVKDLCYRHQVVVQSSNYVLYGDLSNRVMNVLTQMAPEIQVYSIDEAFLLFPNFVSNDELVQHCREIKRIVKKWVGIPISIGIASTKTLSKLASDKAKKDPSGVFCLNQANTDDVLQKCPVDDVWGIGSQTKKKLNALSIHTAFEFKEMDPPVIRKKLGVVGERMLWELRGTSCLPLETAQQPKKSISVSRSFGTNITAISDLAEALSTHTASACTKLRAQRSYAQALTIYLEASDDPHTGSRKIFAATIPLPFPSSDTPQLISLAKSTLSSLFQSEQLYKKCGVILLDLIPETQSPPDLFQPNTLHPKRLSLALTVDAINAHYGKNTLFYGAMGVNPQWKMRANSRSPFSTCSWLSLPVVYA